MEWTFNRGDMFRWVPFGTNLRLWQIEDGIGLFVEVKGFPGTVIDGSPIWEWPLDQYVLQGRRIERLGKR